MAEQKRFSLWQFLFSLAVASVLFYWLAWSIAEGEFRLPNPRPGTKLSPVRWSSQPGQFCIWAALIGGLGLYCLYPAIGELRRFLAGPGGAPSDEPAPADGGVRTETEAFEITVTDHDTGETRTYNSIDELPPELRQDLLDQGVLGDNRTEQPKPEGD